MLFFSQSITARFSAIDTQGVTRKHPCSVTAVSNATVKVSAVLVNTVMLKMDSVLASKAGAEPEMWLVGAVILVKTNKARLSVGKDALVSLVSFVAVIFGV